MFVVSGWLDLLCVLHGTRSFSGWRAAHGGRGRMTGAPAVTERVDGGRAGYWPGKPIRLLNHRANTVARQGRPQGEQWDRCLSEG